MCPKRVRRVVRDLSPLGQGAEQLEEFLAERFAGYPRSAWTVTPWVTLQGCPAGQLERLHAAEAAILVGTQMLAKGHHFRVTLVGVLDADGGLPAPIFIKPGAWRSYWCRWPGVPVAATDRGGY